MATFKYELDNVLNLRKQMEDVKQKEYAESLERLEKEKKKIERSINNNNDNLKECLVNIINPLEIQQQQKYQLSLEKQREVAIEKVTSAANKTVKQRKALLEAMKNKKTLAILKEKRRIEFIAEEKKEEQQVIDEIVSFSHNNSK